MGTSSKQFEDDVLGWHPSVNSQGRVVLRTKLSAVQIEMRSLRFVNKDDRIRQLQKFQSRKKYSDAIVKYFGFKIESQEGFFCSQGQTVNVYIEYLPVRLSSISVQSDKRDQLLLQVLLACRQLIKDFRFQFELTGKHIGITKDGNAKLWINQDFFKNYGEQLAPFSFKQELLVGRIYELMNKCVKNRKQWLYNPQMTLTQQIIKVQKRMAGISMGLGSPQQMFSDERLNRRLQYRKEQFEPRSSNLMSSQDGIVSRLQPYKVDSSKINYSTSK